VSYVPKDYWLEKGKVYRQEFRYNKKFKLQEQKLVEYLKRNISFSTVLELGCGFGRITKIILSNFPEVTDYVAVDLSPHQIENARNYVMGSDKSGVLKFVISDIQSLEMNSKYDLVIAPEVLLHILPSEIKEVLVKMVGWSRKSVVNIDWYEDVTPRKVAPHNFIHEYEKLYQGIPGVSKIIRTPIVKEGLLLGIDTKQSIFHVDVKYE
jgi:SAM-dependent methyltransferase